MKTEVVAVIVACVLTLALMNWCHSLANRSARAMIISGMCGQLRGTAEYVPCVRAALK